MAIFWNNGKFNINWEIVNNLKKFNVDLDSYDNIKTLISDLYNKSLDHSNNGKLDDIGLDIINCIELLKDLNKNLL